MMLSIIVPVYNRPGEIKELLTSLVTQTRKAYEIIIVEDGSSDTCEHIVRNFVSFLPVRYYYKTNSGPGSTRNYGAAKSNGDYLIFLDSDCILPPRYIEEIEKELNNRDADAFGGPDRADESFTRIQKAINYSMTSFFTTGGIRGGKKKMDKFYPRSFNMGIKKSVFEALGGFSAMRFGEDIDLSTRVFKGGYNCRLFPDAWVYHKRRTDFRKFFKQVFAFGTARIVIQKKHPGSLKLVHLLPACFTVGCVLLLLAAAFYPPLLLVFLLYSALIFTDAMVRTGNIAVGFLSVITSYVQLWGYGSGFLAAWWKIAVLKHEKYVTFEKNLYK